jgi:aspartokinase-like uncharacterized kinase
MVIIRHNLGKCECFFASMTWIWLGNYRESVSSWVYILVCLSLVKNLNAVYCTLLIGKYNTTSQQWNSTTLEGNHHCSAVILFPAKSNNTQHHFSKGLKTTTDAVSWWVASNIHRKKWNIPPYTHTTNIPACNLHRKKYKTLKNIRARQVTEWPSIPLSPYQSVLADHLCTSQVHVCSQD